MRVTRIPTLCLLLSVSTVFAQIPPETMGAPVTMPAPGENWFISVSDDGGYIFDATTGEMQGVLRVSSHTPAIQPSIERQQFYLAASYYSRGSYGERTDIVMIQDFTNLDVVGEVEIPKKIASLNFRGYIGLMSGGKHVGVSNLTPGQSVSIVDVEAQQFVGEISTPGCSLILPVDNNDFLTMCGDGTLMLVELDGNGNESGRTRSNRFFDLQEDPVYDRPVETADGWLMLSNNGKAYEVQVDATDIEISDPWDFVTEEDAAENWWPGGNQLVTVHKEMGLFYVTMHQGERYSHHERGTEVWVFNLASKDRVARFELADTAASIMVTQEDEPLLIAGAPNNQILVYDALTFVLQRTITGPSGGLFEDL